MNEVNYLLKELTDPKREIEIIRSGLKTTIVESFLSEQDLILKDVLSSLEIPASTYFAKKKNHQLLDSHTSEKFIRLISVTSMAAKILGEVTVSAKTGQDHLCTFIYTSKTYTSGKNTTTHYHLKKLSIIIKPHI